MSFPTLGQYVGLDVIRDTLSQIVGCVMTLLSSAQGAEVGSGIGKIDENVISWVGLALCVYTIITFQPFALSLHSASLFSLEKTLENITFALSKNVEGQ